MEQICADNGTDELIIMSAQTLIDQVEYSLSEG